jgi:hypothetical protein
MVTDKWALPGKIKQIQKFKSRSNLVCSKTDFVGLKNIE